MRHKKIYSFLILIAMVLLITTVAYAADPLRITTVSLSRGTLGEPYSAKLEAAGGTGEYNFYIHRGNLPTGLSLSSDGVISGIPEDGGLISIYFRVKDSDNNIATKKISVRINAKTVNFTINSNYHEYDGNPKYVQAVSDVDEINEDDYTITYNGLEYPTDIGRYDIEIRGAGLLAKGYKVGSISPRQLVIAANSGSSITLPSQIFEYDGEPHALTPVVEPAEIQNDYTVMYRGRGDTEYGPTDVAPSAVGTYTVTATTTNPNYVTRTATANLTITAPRVNFTVSNVNLTYDGQPHQAEVNLNTPSYEGNFTVTYDDLSTDEVEALESVVDAGQYRINIALSDPNHQVGTMNFDTIVINPRQIDFDVADNIVQYQPGVNEYSASITPSVAGFSDYIVSYVKDGQEHQGSVSDAGTYEIKIDLDNSRNEKIDRNYVVNRISPNTFTVNKVSVSFDVTDNNATFDTSPEKDGYAATVTPRIAGFTDYKVIYVDESGRRYEDKVPDVGVYNIEIEFTGEYAQNYELGSIEPNTFTVNKIKVDFTVSNNSVSFDPDQERTGYAATITPGITGFTDYKVIYVDDNGGRHEEKVTDVGAYTIEIEFTGDYADKYELGDITPNTFNVNPLTVNFTVTGETVEYMPGATEYKATVTPSIEGFENFAVKYVDAGGSEHTDSVAGVGEYDIKIDLTGDNAGNYQVGEITPNKFTVTKKAVNFAVSDTIQEYSPDAVEYKATVTPDVEGIENFSVTYVDAQGVDHEDAVTDVGEYDIEIALSADDDANYRVGAITPNKFTVNKKVVDFTVSDETVNFDPKAADYKATITTPGVENFTDYTVTYIKNGVEYPDKVNEAGAYEIRIELTDMVANHYQKGTVSADTFTVNPLVVNFQIKNNSVDYNPDVDKYAANIVPSVEGFDGFTVTYTRDEASYENEIAATDMAVIGQYAMDISVNDTNYLLGDITGDKVFTVNGPAAKLVLGGGNSPAALIGDDEAALEAFKVNHEYNGVAYDPKAWGDGANYDEDKTAYFIIDKKVKWSDLTWYATYSDGRAVSADDMTITVGDGELPETWLASSPANGVYEMTYSFKDNVENGETITAKRMLIVLNQMGDVNSDRNINAGDAGFLQSQVLTALEEQTPLYLYRVCDVNHDGDVNDADAEAILNRMNVPLVQYYSAGK